MIVVALLLVAAIFPPGSRSEAFPQSYSHSHSISQGTCPVAGLTSVKPSGPAVHNTSIYVCDWIYGEVDNYFGVRDVYPCVFPGGPVLAPTDISLQLSTGGGSDRGWEWINVVMAYNYTHFHHLHPDGVADCYNEPTPGRHNPPFLDWINYGSWAAGCNRICIIEAWYRVQCGADYASAKSGKYYIEIPYVGRFNFNVSICINEKFNDDYAAACRNDAQDCPQDTASVLLSGAAPLQTSLSLTIVAAAAAMLALFW